MEICQEMNDENYNANVTFQSDKTSSNPATKPLRATAKLNHTSGVLQGALQPSYTNTPQEKTKIGNIRDRFRTGQKVFSGWMDERFCTKVVQAFEQ